MATPPYLKKNDKVAIIATASKIKPAEIEAAIKILGKWGLEVVTGKHLYEDYYKFGGNDEQRREDFQSALDNDSIKAIFCVRGGYGTNRIIDQVNFKKFLKKPKWVIGFSDVTVLHSHLHVKNIPTIHAIMPVHFGKPPYKKSLGTLYDALFGKSVKYILPHRKLNRTGTGEGKIVGGNISILCSLIGTSSDIDTRGKILFLEEIGEYAYRLDRMMIQLKRSGKLKNLKGLIVGHMTEIDEEAEFGKTAKEIIADIVKEYNYPVCFDFPVGHEPHNFALICGRKASLKVRESKSELKFL